MCPFFVLPRDLRNTTYGWGWAQQSGIDRIARLHGIMTYPRSFIYQFEFLVPKLRGVTCTFYYQRSKSWRIYSGALLFLLLLLFSTAFCFERKYSPFVYPLHDCYIFCCWPFVRYFVFKRRDIQYVKPSSRTSNVRAAVPYWNHFSIRLGLFLNCLYTYYFDRAYNLYVCITIV